MQTLKVFCVRALTALSLISFFSVFGYTATSVTITPAQVNFGTETVGLITMPHVLTLMNSGSSSVTVTSFTLSGSVFQLCQGLAPFTIAAHGMTHYTLEFAPNSSGNFSGTFTVNLQGQSPITIPLSGTGLTTGAIATVTPATIDFGTLTEGTTSPPQTVTISNTGTTSMKLLSVTADPPFNIPVIASKTLGPGQSYRFGVRFLPTGTVAFRNTLTITYDVVPAGGVSLTGTGIAAAALGITNFPTLPSATQNAAYSAPLSAAGGTPPYTWSLQNGSSLPAGLTLSTSGVISGTLDSSVGVGTYSFIARARDSASPPATRSKQFALAVAAPTGAVCNNISWNVTGTSTPILPLDILGTGTYLGSEGGLYPNGSNIRPASHDAFGVGLATAIQPLDANGNPDPNGRYALVGLGGSTARIVFNQFLQDANADPTKNSKLVVVDGAQGDETARALADPTSAYWNTVINNDLPNAGVTPQQVVAVWVQALSSNPVGPFPDDVAELQADLEALAQVLLVKFPNVKLAYFSNHHYAGYSAGIPSIPNPEPFTFESGFANKWAIQDQLAGDPNLNFDPALGPVLAPWMSWGPYYWANGMIPGTGGLVWTCQDLKDDGLHPSIPAGAEKAANQILNFFKTDDTAVPWFLAP